MTKVRFLPLVASLDNRRKTFSINPLHEIPPAEEVDNKIIYVDACSALDSKFKEFEVMLKSVDFEYYSAFKSQNALEEMNKLTTKFWCISLAKKSFLRMQNMNTKYYTSISMDEFNKKHIAIFANFKFGL